MSGSTMLRLSQRLVVVVIVAFIAMFLFPPWVGVRGSYVGYAFLWNPESPSDSISCDRLAIQVVLVVALAALYAVLRADSTAGSKLRAMALAAGSKLLGVARAVLPTRTERLPAWRRLAWLLIAAWMFGAAYAEVRRAEKMADLQRLLLPPDFSQELDVSTAEGEELKAALVTALQSKMSIDASRTYRPLTETERDELLTDVGGPVLAKLRGFSFTPYPSVQALRDDWALAVYRASNRPTSQSPEEASERKRPPTLGEARFFKLIPYGAEYEDLKLMRSSPVTALMGANALALGHERLTSAAGLPSLVGWPIRRRGYLLAAFLGIAIVALGHAAFGRLVVRDSGIGCTVLCLLIVASLTCSVYAPAR
jgi:hypothetical protein